MRAFPIVVGIIFLNTFVYGDVQKKNTGEKGNNSPSIPGNKAVSMHIDDRPNPFGAAYTRIGFKLEKDDMVGVKLYNIQGQAVGTMADTLLEAGYHNLVVEAWDLSRGVYWCIISTSDSTISRKLTFLK